MLGKAFRARFFKQHDLTAVSKSGKDGNLPCNLSRQGDVEKLFAGPDSFDLVIHTAAFSDVDGCERDPKSAYESNALATKILAEICGQKKIPFIYVSTDYVFNGDAGRPYEESDIPCPVNIYGMTKLAGEYFTKEYCDISAIVRTSWLFGDGNPNNFVNAITQKLLHERVVRVLDDQEDSPTYVKDLAEALERIGFRLASQGQAGHRETYQVCNAGSTTRHAMTVKIKEFLKLKNVAVERADKKDVKNRLAIRPAYAVMSTKHYEASFGVRLRGWEASLKEYIAGAFS